MMKLKKVFVLFLTLCMALSAMPLAAWADGTGDTLPEPEITEPAEPTPAPAEPTPAPAEPTPAPAEPTPAPAEPTPAPAQPTLPPEPEYMPPKVLANGGEYLSLSEALADIGDGEYEVIFLEDISENAVVGKNQSITLILTDCSFSGEIINYGKLTVFGSESGVDGCIITRAYCEKDEDGNVVDEASGETVIEGGNYNGELLVEQKSDAPVSADALPKLLLNSGRFGVDLTRRYLNWDDESAEPEYSASAGSIVITGGVFFADPSEYVAEGYAAIANDGWWAVGLKTEEGALPTEGEGNSPAPGAEIYIDTNEAGDTSGENPEMKLPEEEKPVRQEPELVIIDVDVNITGDGSVVFEGEEFGKGSKLKFVAYSEPVLEIRPAENWKISNVTVGTNGSAIPFGAADKIQLPPLVNYATVNVTFAAIPADEINKAEDNAESTPSGDLPAEKKPDEETGENTQKTEKKPVNQVEIAVNITGEGSVMLDGKEYRNKDSLSLPEFSSPEFTIQPAENWKIYNVTVGANGSAAPYGTESKIIIDSLSYFTTLNVIFAEMKPEEIEALKAETDKPEENSEPEEAATGDTEEQTDEEKQQADEEKAESQITEKKPMLTVSRPKMTSARPPLGASPLLGDPKPDEYTITYKTNGGQFITGVSETKTYTAGEEVVFPTAAEISKADSSGFEGWYDDSELKTSSGTYLPAGSTGDKTFYACWKYDITVIVDTTRGNGTVVWNSPEGEKPISTSFTIPSRTGDTISLTYNPAVNNKVSSVTLSDGTVLTDLDKYLDDSVSKNETITVIFERAVTHSVTFEFNDGTTPKETYNWPVGKEVEFTSPTRTGYVFTGWLCSADNEIYPKTGETYTVSESVTFTAQWELEDYTLTYDSKGGTVLGPETFTINDTIPLSVPTLEGATFEGWYLTPDYFGSPVTEIIGSDNAHNVTVYAKWKYTMCNVTYDYNDGTTPVSNEVKYGTTLTLPSRTRAGYDFKGWQCSADGKTYQAYTTYQVKSDVTFTAQWEKQRVFYKVSVYHTNNGVVYYNGQPLPSGSSFELEEGKTAELKFAATTSGYYVYNCTVNNVRRGSVDGLTIGPIKENEIISVTFAPTFVRPITGDTNSLMLWACLMAASALGMTGTAVLRKKRKAEKH